MACVMTQTGEYPVSDKGSRSMDVSWTVSPRSRLGENALCWYIRGMCMERRRVYCVC